MFGNQYHKPERKRRNRSYTVVEPQYCYEIDKETGKKVVVKNGETNFYAQKQEAYQSTKIYNIIDRVERTGDMSLLGEAVESYFDATTMPKNMMEAKIVQCEVENVFRALPVEEKAKYDNDISKFYKTVNDRLHANAKAAAEKARAAAIAATEKQPDGGKTE